MYGSSLGAFKLTLEYHDAQDTLRNVTIRYSVNESVQSWFTGKVRNDVEADGLKYS